MATASDAAGPIRRDVISLVNRGDLAIILLEVAARQNRPKLHGPSPLSAGFMGACALSVGRRGGIRCDLVSDVSVSVFGGPAKWRSCVGWSVATVANFVRKS